MAGNFTDFGDLVLIIGDFHVPQRAVDLPPCFRELLHTDKIRHVLCTGNVGSEQILEFLRGIAGSVHIVKGDTDEGTDFPEYRILQFGKAAYPRPVGNVAARLRNDVLNGLAHENASCE